MSDPLDNRRRRGQADRLNQADPAIGALTGTVHLTMPASAWLGQSDTPGEVAGFGPVDADTCRDLAQRLAANAGTRWCLTLTSRDGHALAHGCASTGPQAPRQATTRRPAQAREPPDRPAGSRPTCRSTPPAGRHGPRR